MTRFHIRKTNNFDVRTELNDYEIFIETRNPCPFMKLLGKGNNFVVKSPFNINMLAPRAKEDSAFLENYWNLNQVFYMKGQTSE